MRLFLIARLVAAIAASFMLGFFSQPASAQSACERFDALDKQVRDGLLPKADAERRLAELLSEIVPLAPADSSVFRFPLAGYTPKNIGGKKGEGYKPQGYDYFDGNRHGGHPAHDIFIFDANQDALDDRTGKPVSVLSVTSGIVVALSAEWDTSAARGAIRGGNYVWVYDAARRCFFYYAHLARVTVKVGDRLQSGAVIGDIGRTGLNAYKKRSPTHLHFACLKVENGYPKPIDIYTELCNAATK